MCERCVYTSRSIPTQPRSRKLSQRRWTFADYGLLSVTWLHQQCHQLGPYICGSQVMTMARCLAGLAMDERQTSGFGCNPPGMHYQMAPVHSYSQ